MEISPDELCAMISDPCESSPDEVLELVDTYLCTTMDLIIEAVFQRVNACNDKCKSKKHYYCNKLITSLLHQVAPMRSTNLLSTEAKSYLDQMEKLIK